MPFSLRNARRAYSEKLPNDVFFIFCLVLLWIANIVFYSGFRTFIYTSAASALVSIASVWSTIVMFRSRHVSIIRLKVYMSALWYLLPLAYYTSLRAPGFLNASDAELVGAASFIALCLSIGWLVSYIVTAGPNFPRNMSSFISNPDVWFLIGPLVALQLVLVATGVWSYDATHGSAADTDVGVVGAGGAAAALRIFTGDVTSGIGPLLAYNYGLLASETKSVRLRAVVFAVIGFEALFFLISERRALMIMIALSAIAYTLGRFPGRISSKQLLSLALAGLIAASGLSAANKLFYTMRLASGSLGEHQNLSVPEIINAMSSIDPAVVEQEMAANVSARPFIIESVVIFLRNAKGYLYGRELLDTVTEIIPSALFPNKEAFLQEYGRMPENLWSIYLGVPFLDYANTYLLDGYADFSYIGFAIEAALAALMFRLVAGIISISRNETLIYLFIFGFLFNIMSVENAFASSILLERNFLLLCGLFGTLLLFVSLLSLSAPRHGFSLHGLERGPLAEPSKIDPT